MTQITENILDPLLALGKRGFLWQINNCVCEIDNSVYYRITVQDGSGCGRYLTDIPLADLGEAIRATCERIPPEFTEEEHREYARLVRSTWAELKLAIHPPGTL